jgi:glycosyltransferase involved in cell wall biosynthesis
MIDPINYTGLAYSDAGLCTALQAQGIETTLAGSEGWLLPQWPTPFKRIDIFRGTHGSRSVAAKGTAYLRSLVRLLTQIRRAMPDVVHWQFFELPPADYLAVRILRRWGIPQVYTAHEVLPWDDRSYNRLVFRRMFKSVDGIIAHNRREALRLVEEFGVARQRVNVIVLGNYDLFTTPDRPQPLARRQLGLPLDAPIALFFGSIRASKGLEVLLAAWARVVEQLPNALLAVVGKPYKRLDTSHYLSAIRELGIQERVVVRFEQVDPDTTNNYYRAADVVVLPYHDIATSGVLRYAYSSARAVVATAVGEHTDWVIPGETGSLVPPRNPEAIAGAVISLLGDRPRAEQIGRSAMAYGRANFDWNTSAVRTVAFYARVASRDRPHLAGCAMQPDPDGEE